MADPKLKLGNDIWATKQKSLLAYNDEGGNFKSLPFQVDRISGGSYVGRNGLIQYAASNEPRIDFLNNTKGGLLLEPQRTNSITHSEDFSDGSWNKNNATVTANNTTAPDGSSSADLITSTGTAPYARVTFTHSTLTDYCVSIFGKKGDEDYLYIRALALSSQPIASFNLSTGTLGTINSGLTAEIESHNNGWYRCIIKYTTTSSISNNLIDFGFASSDNSRFSSSGKFAYFWGAQVDVANTKSSYIPTSGGAVTRVQDYIAKGGNEYIFNDSEGVLYAEIQALANDQTYRFISISDNSASSNRVVISYNTTSNQIRCDLIVGGSTQSSFATNSYDITQKNKVAIKYKLNDVKMFANGLQVGSTDTSANVFPSGTLNQINFDNGNLGSTFYFEGFLNDLQYFDEALSDAELATLTTL